jgi:tRNA(fMet)-specific endonuclease VapC
MYLLDTDTVIYILRADPVAVANLKKHIHDPIKIGTVTLLELYYGAYKSQKVTSNLAKIRTLENVMEIIPIGEEVAEIFGKEKVRLEKEGTPLDDFDLVLGCCALAHNLTLVTNNVKHFKRIEGVQVTNWMEE